MVGCGFFKSRERLGGWMQNTGGELPERISFFVFPLFSQAVSFIFSLTVCKYLRVSVSFTLSLFKRGGKDTHPAAFAAAPDFFPFPLRKFPICLCAGLVERPSGVETVSDAHTDWEAHSCM